MRLFFALECPAKTAVAIADWRDRQLPALPRPVAMANFHITLAFLGEVDERSLDRLCRTLNERPAAAAGSVLLNQTGYWPRPGILWLGPTRWPPGLEQLSVGLQKLGRRGSGKQRSGFQPHITLFRQCTQGPPAPTLAPKIPFEYDHLVLFESQQGRHGVSYHALAEWPLVRELQSGGLFGGETAGGDDDWVPR